MGRSAFILTIKVVEETRSRLELSSKQCFGSCGDTHIKVHVARQQKEFLEPLAPVVHRTNNEDEHVIDKIAFLVVLPKIQVMTLRLSE